MKILKIDLVRVKINHKSFHKSSNLQNLQNLHLKSISHKIFDLFFFYFFFKCDLSILYDLLPGLTDA